MAFKEAITIQPDPRGATSDLLASLEAMYEPGALLTNVRELVQQEGVRIGRKHQEYRVTRDFHYVAYASADGALSMSELKTPRGACLRRVVYPSEPDQIIRSSRLHLREVTELEQYGFMNRSLLVIYGSMQYLTSLRQHTEELAEQLLLGSTDVSA